MVDVRAGRREEDPVEVVRRRILQGALPGPNRYFGGFAFGAANHRNPHWEPFGSARFQGPEVIIEKSSSGCLLQVAVEADGDVSATDALNRWEAHVDALPPASISGKTGALPELLGDDPEEKARWSDMVRRALAEIDAGAMEKAVLARSTQCTVQIPTSTVVERLWRTNPRAWTFLFEPEAGRAFLGASPESLAVLLGGNLTATAVAGSQRRSQAPEEDRELGEGLLKSTKDLHEHAVVVEGMVRRLSRVAERVEPPAQPRLLSLAGIHHLETLIRATLPPGTTALDVVGALHPTAAVCGSPPDAARRFIVEQECFDRGWYGGPVGWFDLQGSGAFVPGLRCALLGDRQWSLFAGAGIVEGSAPEREWEETRLKFRTALTALAKDADPS